MTTRVTAAIHWQALRLWLKRAPFRRYPGPHATPDGPSGFAKPRGAH